MGTINSTSLTHGTMFVISLSLKAFEPGLAQLRPAGTKFMCERVATNDDDDNDDAADDDSDNDFDDNDDDEPDAEAQDDTGNRL